MANLHYLVCAYLAARNGVPCPERELTEIPRKPIDIHTFNNMRQIGLIDLLTEGYVITAGGIRYLNDGVWIGL